MYHYSLFMGSHYMNNETWKFKEADTKHLMTKNEAKLDGFRVVATIRIEAGTKIEITYYLEDTYY